MLVNASSTASRTENAVSASSSALMRSTKASTPPRSRIERAWNSVAAGSASLTSCCSRRAVWHQCGDLSGQPLQVNGLGVEIIAAGGQRAFAVGVYGVRGQGDDRDRRGLRVG